MFKMLHTFFASWVFAAAVIISISFYLVWEIQISSSSGLFFSELLIFCLAQGDLHTNTDLYDLNDK